MKRMKEKMANENESESETNEKLVNNKNDTIQII